MKRELHQKGIKKSELYKYSIIQDGLVHMARLAIYASRSVNGVAEIHTEILKNDALNEWFRIYPERFNNKTNGITPRRWLGLCNKELSEFITENIGDGWIYNLDEINKMIPFAEDNTKIDEFIRIKKIKKQQLCEFIEGKEGIRLNPDFVFDVQIKRLHEYKRQLLNAFSIMDIYFGLKDGRIRELCPTVFLFGAKAAPGYKRAKGIIKYINEIADLVNNDPEVNDKMRVLFVQNYNVSYAEKIIPATDISEQISTAGTEASGTGNMKFMLNGAVTLGTLDGANVEIVREAGMENNYIFGGTVEDFQSLGSSYNPVNIYNNNMRIKKVVDTLIDGTFSDGKTGIFKELYDSILEGASWHAPDVYKLLYDFESYCDTKVLAINGTAEKREFAKKCFVNMACAGKFSSDRTIMDYDREIWHTSSEK
jgi:starch phosphorylase